MKRKHAILAAAAAVAVSAAVLALQPPELNVQSALPEPVEVVYASDIESPQIPPRIAESVNEFAFDFYEQASEDGENMFFSPLSIYTAFSILYEGARNDTASQMLAVFGFEPDAAARHADSASMMAALNAEDPHAVLEAANALWIADWFEPYEQYLDISRQTYLATAEKVVFETDDKKKPAVKTINDWASAKTRGKITTVILEDQVGANTAAVINNAVYFKGSWTVPFPKENTHAGQFRTGGSGSVDADFMLVADVFDYASAEDAQILRMPYEGDRLSMLVVLPREEAGIDSLEMSAGQMAEWLGMLQSERVVVLMPKFEIQTNYDLKQILREAMPDVFSENLADLSGIANTESGNLYVTDASHAAYVKVNEEGTEAAAVTTIIFGSESQPPRFVADRPFLFAIYDEQSGTILFMGKITDP